MHDEVFIPAHVYGRNFNTLKDSRATLDEIGLDVGGYIRVSTPKDSQKTSVENGTKIQSTEYLPIHSTVE